MIWQPIETAPKDGTSILIGCDYSRLGKQRVALVWFERKAWVEAKHWDDDADDWVFQACEFRASHWMPLPSPPGADLSDALALRAVEAALREAAEVCQGIRGRIARGPMPEGARFDYEQAILSLSAKDILARVKGGTDG